MRESVSGRRYSGSGSKIGKGEMAKVVGSTVVEGNEEEDTFEADRVGRF